MSLHRSKSIRPTSLFSPLKLLSASPILIGLTLCLLGGAAQTAPLLPNSIASEMRANIEQIRAVVRRGGAVVGPRGGVAYRSRTVVRPGYRGAGTRYVRPVRPIAPVRPWVRPTRYWWPVGGAVAAGAAVGFVTAATAAAWAGSPPAPGYCWYYTDPSRTKGFWDACPR